MKRIVIGAVALVGAGIASLPAAAADYGVGGNPGYEHAPRAHRTKAYRTATYRTQAYRTRARPAYGRPLFDEGLPPYGVVVEYKPAYIGRGLVYNVPPRPTRAYGYESVGYEGEGLRVRY